MAGNRNGRSDTRDGLIQAAALPLRRSATLSEKARLVLHLWMIVLLFGAYALADGILGSWTAISHRKDQENWWVLLLGGLLGIGVGALTLFNPGVTGLVLLFYIAIWAIATGVLEIVTAIRLRKEIEGEWMLVVAGLASVAFGGLLMSAPGAGALAMLWLIASYAVLFGILFVVLAFKIRGAAKKIEARASA
jgi:uncharacterized membrane protein HdeD (DUF308 family)